MVDLERRNLLSYVFKDVICEILLGLRDSCLGFKSVVFNAARAQLSKPVQHDLRESSASVSQKKSRSKKDQSKNLSLKTNDAHTEAIKCAGFNAVLLGFACFVIAFVGFCQNLVWDLDKTSWSFNIIRVAVHMIALIPNYFIVKVASTFWLQELSNKAYCKRYGSIRALSYAHIGNVISDVIFSAILESLLAVQAIVLEFLLPTWLAIISSVVHYSLLNALYEFEYLWCNEGWNLHKRVSYIEANWPYFFGFGLPLTAITYSIPLYFCFSGLVFSIFYPLFIVAAINAHPHTRKQRGPSLKVFCLVISFTTYVSDGVSNVFTLWKSRR